METVSDGCSQPCYLLCQIYYEVIYYEVVRVKNMLKYGNTVCMFTQGLITLEGSAQHVCEIM